MQTAIQLHRPAITQPAQRPQEAAGHDDGDAIEIDVHVPLLAPEDAPTPQPVLFPAAQRAAVQAQPDLPALAGLRAAALMCPRPVLGLAIGMIAGSLRGALIGGRVDGIEGTAWGCMVGGVAGALIGACADDRRPW